MVSFLGGCSACHSAATDAARMLGSRKLELACKKWNAVISDSPEAVNILAGAETLWGCEGVFIVSVWFNKET